MTIRTNRLNIHFNIPEIEKDFTFIRLERNQKERWWGAKELDIIMEDEGCKARAVCFAQHAYAMFYRSTITDIYEFLNSLRKKPEFSSLSVIEVFPESKYIGNANSICGVTLARILINSLAASKSRYSNFHFSNLTGSLLLVPSFSKKLYDSISVAEISITKTEFEKEFLLNVSVGTYRKKISLLHEFNTANVTRKEDIKKLLRRPEYYYHAGRNCLIRWLSFSDSTSDPKLTYIKCANNGRRLHTNFIEFDSLSNFESSRAGIFHSIFKSIKNELSKYMHVESFSRDFDHSLGLTHPIMKNPSQLLSKLDGTPMRIVDCIGNDESAELTRTLKKALAPYVSDQKQITIGKKDKVNTLNFRIIHNAAYYEDNGLKDEYLPSTDDYHRQHLTFEASNSGIHEAMVKTLIKEQLIKRDIAQGQLSLFDWLKLNATKVWIFAACDKKAK
ncbi:conserved hypothetical protein [Candidatus Methylobacter favarea]|uniref:Uncharacterized protein n=1 Tax=Candidatus Methylobacter favarea TaxID=2707345 RepID=A0A8S0XIS0_9GAMM|nr:hypothetical protein [Candidatus Methylobacter favarea]CAA9892663.1 conserved hypothetical protein [Candidatus Methylobacter favarea]